MGDSICSPVKSLISAELPALWRFSLQITRDKHDAEDLVQRTCVRAMEQSNRYEENHKLKSWLFKIAQNLWLNELRYRAVRERGHWVASDPDEEVPLKAAALTSTPDKRLEAQEVVSAVENLPEAQRMVMFLVCVDGFSYAEAASILEVPIGTVMSRLARARIAIGRQFLVEDTINQGTNQSDQTAKGYRT